MNEDSGEELFSYEFAFANLGSKRLLKKSFLNFKALIFIKRMNNILLPLVLLPNMFTIPAQYIYVQEDFNTAALPIGWSTTAVTGSAAWSTGIDGFVANLGINNLNVNNI